MKLDPVNIFKVDKELLESTIDQMTCNNSIKHLKRLSKVFATSELYSGREIKAEINFIIRDLTPIRKVKKRKPVTDE